MLFLNPLATADLRQSVLTTAICWRIQKNNGDLILGCEHDRDLKVTVTDPYVRLTWPTCDLTGRYEAQTGISGSNIKSSADLSADNLEVEGAIDRLVGLPGVSTAEIEGGLLTHAPVIVFAVNWVDPDRWQIIRRRGHLGEWSWDSDGRYRSEVRGLAQLFSQSIGQTFTERCSVVRFGDVRCGFDLASAARIGTIASVANRKVFTAALSPDTDPPIPAYFNGGELSFSSGENAGSMREAKRVTVAAGIASVELWDEAAGDVLIGDTFTMTPGCDRTKSTCKLHGRFTTINGGWRGYGLFMPGIDALTRGPT